MKHLTLNPTYSTFCTTCRLFLKTASQNILETLVWLFVFRLGPEGYQLDRQLSAVLQQLVPGLGHSQLQGLLGPALVASLSSDAQLREALLQGLSLFTVAAAKAGTAGQPQTALGGATTAGESQMAFIKAGTAGPRSQNEGNKEQDQDDRGRSTLLERESQAESIVTAVQISLVKAIGQVSRTVTTLHVRALR